MVRIPTYFFELRATFMLVIIAAYMILNTGFMQVGVGPFPLGETLVAVFGLFFLYDVRKLPNFAYVAPLTPLLLWWFFGLIKLMFAVQTYGIWALRDATHLIDSFYVWIGFVVAASPRFMERFSTWLRLVLLVGVFYSFLFPFRDALAKYSPTVQSLAGYTDRIFFKFDNGCVLILAAAFQWILDRKRFFGISAVVFSGIVVVYSATVFQMRTTYVQICVFLVILAMIRPLLAAKMTVAMAFGIAVMSLVLAMGVEIQGRLGENFSFDFFIAHVLSIVGIGTEGATGSAAGGVHQRWAWWSTIYNDLTLSVSNALFGLGFGFPLTDFEGLRGVMVREPHNSLISVGARMGLVGLVLFVWIQLSFLKTWISIYTTTARNGMWTLNKNIMIVGAIFLFIGIFSMFEDGLEKPNNAIPYYFLWGVMLRMAVELHSATGQLRVPQSEPKLAPHGA